MNRTLHQRAQQLFAQSLVEGIGPEDQVWLNAHLRSCSECASECSLTQELLQAFRRVPVAVPQGLAARAQLRIRLRAQEAAQTAAPSALLWIITAASWVLGVISAPLVWRVFAWVGSELSLPKLMLEVGFVLWWTAPALIAVAVVLYQRATGPARSSL